MRLSLYPGHAIRLLLIDITFSVCDIDITCFDKYLKNGSHNRSSFLIAVSGENRKICWYLEAIHFLCFDNTYWNVRWSGWCVWEGKLVNITYSYVRSEMPAVRTRRIIWMSLKCVAILQIWYFLVVTCNHWDILLLSKVVIIVRIMWYSFVRKIEKIFEGLKKIIPS